MNTLHQTPAPGTMLRRFAGDVLEITLRVPATARGRAFVRTNIGHARAARAERLAAAREARAPLATDWRDLPMRPLGQGLHSARIPLAEPGLFAAKALFLPDDVDEPLWPDGADLRLKVAPAIAAARNSIYTAFPRQFLSSKPKHPNTQAPNTTSSALDNRDFAVIPPSGTFREVARHLDHILGPGGMGFGILQLLPIHPAPTVYARMGRYGSPFAALDFLAVDPALAEFDPAATPMDQFQELLDAVHARGARLFLDLPANHTGWASTALEHHPEWFRREDDGRFHSPGAWGVVWEDLVELDHRRPGVREFIAEVFEFWCAKGVDGFRCDAGYMIPAEVWSFVVDRVRSRFPDTVFFLEGLGGSVETTRALLDTAGLDSAYSELFQTEDRSAFERYLPGAQALSDSAGPLVHFAETHDNLRLAARSPAYARMRVRLAALLSSEGAFGITNGVEWFATEKVDVHGASDLHWGAKPNLVDDIRRLHALLDAHPAFGPGAAIEMVQQGPGNALAVLRTASRSVQGRSRPCCLVLANLDAERPQPVQWPAARFDAAAPVDLLSGAAVRPEVASNGQARLALEPAQVLCLSAQSGALGDRALPDGGASRPGESVGADLRAARLRAAVLAARDALAPGPLGPGEDPAALAAAFAADPFAALAALSGADAPPRVTELRLPADFRRVVPVPPGHVLLARADAPFRIGGGALPRVESVPLDDGSFAAVIGPLPAAPANAEVALEVRPGITPPSPAGAFPLWEGGKRGEKPPSERGVARSVPVDPPPSERGVARSAGGSTPRGTLRLLALGTAEPRIRTSFPGEEIRRDPERAVLLTNGRGAMAHVRAAWPAVASRYDALLAANPDPAVPCDRWMLLTRCRLWLRHVGTSQPLNATCLERLDTAPDFARWIFRAPIGRGETARVAVELRMPPGRNAVALTARRLEGPETLSLILRPDIESRSFHELTKAYAGAEKAWPRACAPTRDGIGVDFRPAGLPGLALRASCGAYVPEPEWSYCVALPVDAQRGMEASSDLFSPGYFRIPLSTEATLVAAEASESAKVRACASAGAEESERAGVRAGASSEPGASSPTSLAPTPPVPLSSALTAALRAYVVARDDVQTVIAGYPWFLDWGRDTFIVLRGMLAAGMLDESLAIVRAFARFERGGTLPNMIRGNDDSNRDTSDAPLWFSVAAHDLCDRLGRDRALALDCGGRTLADVLEGIAAGYRRGTPNGIAMDPATALVFSPSHFTWMDTNFPAGTPRRGYPVEIQALWISALRFLAEIRPGGDWAALADRAAESVRRLFWLPKRGYFSDCLHADRPGAPAVADDALRPNQLLLLTLGVLPARSAEGRAMLRACAALLVPGAIRTLADAPVEYPQPVERDGRLLNDPLRPYWGRYEGDEDTRRKPAYHNGTAWTWPFPLYAEALLAAYGPAAEPEARALLASGAGLAEGGVIGHLPEILDGDAPHAQRGCDAQAWGVSEFVRVFRKLP